MSFFETEHQKQVVEALSSAGAALGLQPAKYKQVSASWQMQPLAGFGAGPPAFVHGCVAGKHQGRLVSATMMLPEASGSGGGTGPFKMSPIQWSEGQLLVTSVGFIGQVIPFVAAAPTAPVVVNEHRTYKWFDWFPGLGVHEFGTRIPMPGDTGGAWMVRAIQTERPAAILAAIAPLLLREPPYPWRVDGGKKHLPVVDLVRVDLTMPGTPPPSAEILRERFERLTELATTIEQTIAQLPKAPHH